MNNETEIQSLTREELEARRKNTNSLLPQTSSDNPLKLHVLASGSKGNCCVIESSLTGDFFLSLIVAFLVKNFLQESISAAFI